MKNASKLVIGCQYSKKDMFLDSFQEEGTTIGDCFSGNVSVKAFFGGKISVNVNVHFPPTFSLVVKCLEKTMEDKQAGTAVDEYSQWLFEKLKDNIWKELTSRSISNIEDAHPLIRYLIKTRCYHETTYIGIDELSEDFRESSLGSSLHLTSGQVEKVLMEQIELFHLEHDISLNSCRLMDGSIDKTIGIHRKLRSRFYSVIEEDC